MGQIIRMPTEDEVRSGVLEDFMTVMFHLYKSAHRPTLRAISKAIEDNGELAGTASPETIRRMLRGDGGSPALGDCRGRDADPVRHGRCGALRRSRLR
jgi:hypothetical protein